MSKYILEYQGNYKTWNKPLPIKLWEDWTQWTTNKIQGINFIVLDDISTTGSTLLFRFNNAKMHGYTRSLHPYNYVIADLFKFSLVILSIKGEQSDKIKRIQQSIPVNIISFDVL